MGAGTAIWSEEGGFHLRRIVWLSPCDINVSTAGRDNEVNAGRSRVSLELSLISPFALPPWLSALTCWSEAKD